MQTVTHLPEPSSNHATCAWCATEHSTVIELIDHVDTHQPTATEVAAIVAAAGFDPPRGSGREELGTDESKSAHQFTITCAWCASKHSTVIELMEHVDKHHQSRRSSASGGQSSATGRSTGAQG